MSPATTQSDVRTDPRAFRRALVIDAGGQPKRLDDAMDDWQRTDFEALDGASQQVAGVPVTYPVKRRAWCERPRGHSKTTDFSVMAAWMLIAANRPIKGFWFAVDKDQAALAINAFRVLVALNPVLRAVLTVNKDEIVNKRTGSTLKIMASDVASSWGLLADFIFCDEVTHWSETGGQELFGSAFSTAAKVESCLFVVITNAGFADTWQAKLSVAAQSSDKWYYSRLDGPQASWISQETLDEQRAILPPTVYARVWLNVWSTTAGDALTAEEIDACVRPTIALPSDVFEWIDRGCSQSYPLFICAALDIGIKRDHTALQGYIADPGRRKIWHCYSQSWAPPKGGEVKLADVEAAVEQFAYDFPGVNVLVDPWQAMGMIQRLKARGLYNVHAMPSTPKELAIQATHLVEAFRDRIVSLLPDVGLVEELKMLRIIENPVGYKLHAPRDRVHGHCDKAIASAMAISAAMDVIVGNCQPYGDDGLGDHIPLDLPAYDMAQRMGYGF